MGGGGERAKPPLLQSKSRLAVSVMTHEVSQLARVATLPARPFMLTGSICRSKTSLRSGMNRSLSWCMGWPSPGQQLALTEKIPRALHLVPTASILTNGQHLMQPHAGSVPGRDLHLYWSKSMQRGPTRSRMLILLPQTDKWVWSQALNGPHLLGGPQEGFRGLRFLLGFMAKEKKFATPSSSWGGMEGAWWWKILYKEHWQQMKMWQRGKKIHKQLYCINNRDMNLYVNLDLNWATRSASRGTTGCYLDGDKDETP